MITDAPKRAEGQAATIVLALIIATVLPVAGITLYRELKIDALEDAVGQAVAGEAGAQSSADALIQAMSAPWPKTPRVLLASAALDMDKSRTARPTARAALLAAGEAKSREAAKWPAYTAQALVQAAFAQAAGRDDAGARATISRSYDLAPYLRTAGAWRISYVAATWQESNPRVRRMALNETMWLRQIDPALASTVMAAFGDPAANLAITSRIERAKPRGSD